MTPFMYSMCYVSTSRHPTIAQCTHCHRPGIEILSVLEINNAVSMKAGTRDDRLNEILLREYKRMEQIPRCVHQYVRRHLGGAG